MEIGFTIDEKCFNRISAEELINEASENDIKGVEISPDTDVLAANEYEKIIKLASNNLIEVNYHIPYFANSIYDISNFAINKNKFIHKYEEFLSLIYTFQEFIINAPIIVIHGAKYNNQSDKKEALYATQSFFDWMLNIFESKNLDFKIAIETLGVKDERSIGDERSDILYIVNSFKTERLVVCWDMCHDALNYYPESVPIDYNLLENVGYCHVHGTDLSKKISHISLAKSDIDYTDQINNLTKVQYNGVINIELLINYCEETYIDDLFKDIKYLKKLTTIV